jgi:hypothetical protein
MERSEAGQGVGNISRRNRTGLAEVLIAETMERGNPPN